MVASFGIERMLLLMAHLQPMPFGFILIQMEPTFPQRPIRMPHTLQQQPIRPLGLAGN